MVLIVAQNAGWNNPADDAAADMLPEGTLRARKCARRGPHGSEIETERAGHARPTRSVPRLRPLQDCSFGRFPQAQPHSL